MTAVTVTQFIYLLPLSFCTAYRLYWLCMHISDLHTEINLSYWLSSLKHARACLNKCQFTQHLSVNLRVNNVSGKAPRRLMPWGKSTTPSVPAVLTTQLFNVYKNAYCEQYWKIKYYFEKKMASSFRINTQNQTQRDDLCGPPANTEYHTLAIMMPLTRWGRDKMDAISQTTFWSAFSWRKMFEFRLEFHWNLFLRVQLTIFQQWFR